MFNYVSIKKSLVNIYVWFRKLFNTIYYSIVYRKDDTILLDFFGEQWFGNLQHRNFGDELNVFLVENLTGQKVINKHNLFSSRNKYMVIGSIVEGYSTPNSIIWGSGAIEGNGRKLKDVPLEVRAVRGKLTRKYLLDNQVDCPDVYGDPALLLPFVYKPNVDKKYYIGLIPHIYDANNILLINLVNRSRGNIKLIKFFDYGNWHDVIDEINQCQYVVSSSLHGLIIADAYKIPNLWIQVSNQIIGGSFKYLDYFSGVNRKPLSPFIITSDTEFTDFLEFLVDYEPIQYNFKQLIDSCPFTINVKI